MAHYVKNQYGFRYLAICASCGHCEHEQIDSKNILRPCRLHGMNTEATNICPDWKAEHKFDEMRYSEPPANIKSGEYLHYLANYRDSERRNQYMTFTPIETIREQWENENGKSIYVNI